MKGSYGHSFVSTLHRLTAVALLVCVVKADTTPLDLLGQAYSPEPAFSGAALSIESFFARPYILALTPLGTAASENATAEAERKASLLVDDPGYLETIVEVAVLTWLGGDSAAWSPLGCWRDGAFDSLTELRGFAAERLAAEAGSGRETSAEDQPHPGRRGEMGGRVSGNLRMIRILGPQGIAAGSSLKFINAFSTLDARDF